MPESLRQQIINAVDVRLKTIKIANGYETDIGLNVNRWKAIPISSDKEYELIYRDVSEDASAENAAIGKHEHTLHFEVEIITKAGSISDNQIRKMIADIEKSISAGETWGGLAQRTIPEGNEINILQSEKIIGGAIIRFAIIYRTNRWNPYS